MNTLKNWNDWCNDKILLTSADTEKDLIISPNAILGIEGGAESTILHLVDGIIVEAKEDVETILGYISELIVASNARREAAAKAQREQYEALQAAAKEDAKASEG
jgi:hypothetical protein